MAGRGFVRRAIRRLLDAEAHALGSEGDAARRGLLQSLDPRVRIVCAGLLLVGVAASLDLAAVVATLVFVVALASLSSLRLRSMLLRVWLPVLLFTFVIASPALVTTPGTTAFVIPVVSWQVTEQGLRAASMLLARVLTAGTIAYVLVVSTSWPRVLAALRRLRVPAPVVVLLGMTYRYIFLLTSAAHDMLLSRESRSVGRLSGAARRSVTTAMAGSLMLRSLTLSVDVHHAMQSRGFRGSYDSLDTFHARGRDAVALTLVLIAATIAIWSGR